MCRNKHWLITLAPCSVRGSENKKASLGSILRIFRPEILFSQGLEIQSIGQKKEKKSWSPLFDNHKSKPVLKKNIKSSRVFPFSK